MRILIFIASVVMSFQTGFAGIKAVLFDCDGTLVDSEYIHYLGWKRALVHFGSDLTLDEYYPYVGKSAETNATFFAEKVGFDCQEQILSIKRESPELCAAGVPPIEPTVNLLRQLAARKEELGIKIGICSAASKATIVSHLQHLGIEELCDIILSGKEDLSDYSDPEGTNKPKPYIYQHAMKKLGVFPAQCVVIEDSSTGVLSAVSAGCFTVAVPNVYTCNQDLSSAHLRLESFLDISVDDFLQKVGDLNKKINNKINDVIQDTVQHSQSRQRRYIITGGPGSGKTSVINNLAKKGYLIAKEAATDIIEEGLKQNLKDPWMADDYHIKVSSLMAKRQKEIENSLETIAFFDRGHLDGITYILLQRRQLPQAVVDYVQSTIAERFFDKTVFFIENLGFCEQAPNRTETLEEALEKSFHIKQNYLALGYEVIDIPHGTIEQRSEQILRHVQQHMIPPTAPKLPLISSRLILRDFIQEDIPMVIDIANHSKFSGYLRFHPKKIPESVAFYIEEAIEMQKPDLITGHREIFRLAICLKENHSQVIGCCVLHGWNKSPDDNDQIGYFIHPEYQGNGYATEALSCLVGTYFLQYPERNIEAIVRPDNPASQKVLKKLGFLRSREKNIDVHGMQEPRIIYTLSAKDFTCKNKLQELSRPLPCSPTPSPRKPFSR